MKYKKIISLVDNIFADVVAESYDHRITKVSKNLQQNNTEAVNEHDKVIFKEGHISKIKYQKVTNLLDDTPNQPTKPITKNWVEINDDTPKSYNTSSQNIFEFSMIKSNLFVYRKAYILLSGTITFTK